MAKNNLSRVNVANCASGSGAREKSATSSKTHNGTSCIVRVGNNHIRTFDRKDIKTL